MPSRISLFGNQQPDVIGLRHKSGKKELLTGFHGILAHLQISSLRAFPGDNKALDRLLVLSVSGGCAKHLQPIGSLLIYTGIDRQFVPLIKVQMIDPVKISFFVHLGQIRPIPLTPPLRVCDLRCQPVSPCNGAPAHFHGRRGHHQAVVLQAQGNYIAGAGPGADAFAFPVADVLIFVISGLSVYFFRGFIESVIHFQITQWIITVIVIPAVRRFRVLPVLRVPPVRIKNSHAGGSRSLNNHLSMRIDHNLLACRGASVQ